MGAHEPIGRTAAAFARPLEGDLLAMDVVDTLRRNPGLRESPETGDEATLGSRLAAIYAGQGIAADEAGIEAGIEAFGDGRFDYSVPSGPLARMARLYVARRRWGPPAVALALMLIIGLGGYFFAWRPFHEAQLAAARQELTVTMPAQMDQLYQTIFTETKVQQAVNIAGQIITKGKAAAEAGDRAGAQKAIDGLTAIRDQLREEYTLRIVNREGEKTAFWTFPKVSTAATYYYVVVEAIDPSGRTLTLPITDEDTGNTSQVSIWAIRVPEEVYRAVESDRLDDGVLQRGVLGIKEFGFLDLEYAMPVIGGTVTQWPK